MKVWILVFFISIDHYSGGAGGPAVIDNIASKQECERIAALFDGRTPKDYLGSKKKGRVQAECIEVAKVKP